MTFGVILLDVFEICRLLHPRNIPIQVLQIAMDTGVIVPYSTHIKFEMLHIDGVEPDQGSVSFEIKFRDSMVKDIRAIVGNKDIF